MSSLNFQKQFAPGILAMLDKDYARRTGVKPKTTTIRAKVQCFYCAQHTKGKRAIQKGDILHLFTGLRTKKVRLLGKITCRKTEEFVIEEEFPGILKIIVNGANLSEEAAQNIALEDGFTTLREMIKWFSRKHGFPFAGQRIHLANTYDRKYYLHKRTKDLGINIELRRCEKTIEVTPDQVETVLNSRHISELAKKHSYGIQIINPLFK